MPSGGRRLGAGRKHGSKNRRTADIALKATESGLTPVEYLLSVMRDETQPQSVRVQCAMAAAPYTTPRLASVHITKKNDDALKNLYDKIKRENGFKVLEAHPVVADSLALPLPAATDVVFSHASI